MKIIIEYLTKRSEIRKQIEFTPDLFFDEDEDGFSIDSIPKYIFPYEYLEIEKEELILVSLLIEDGLSYVKRDMFFGMKVKMKQIIIFLLMKRKRFSNG